MKGSFSKGHFEAPAVRFRGVIIMIMGLDNARPRTTVVKIGINGNCCKNLGLGSGATTSKWMSGRLGKQRRCH